MTRGGGDAVFCVGLLIGEFVKATSHSGTSGQATSFSARLVRASIWFGCGCVCAWAVVVSFGIDDSAGGQPATESPPGSSEQSKARSESSQTWLSSAAGLMALSDDELDQRSILELNLAVFRDIENIPQDTEQQYQQTIKQCASEFSARLKQIAPQYHQNPELYHNDFDFFKAGMLMSFLAKEKGILYVESQRDAQIEATKKGLQADYGYTNPNDLFLTGVLDTKRGTCASLPTLHVAIARELGWPMSLATAGSHMLSCWDDGKKSFTIECTQLEHGGFAAYPAHYYIDEGNTSEHAVRTGADLRALTSRETLGLFISLRARHFLDIGQYDRAAHDYALAFTLIPSGRVVNTNLIGELVRHNEDLYEVNERGHPLQLARFLMGRYQHVLNPQRSGPSSFEQHVAEVVRINAMNRRRYESMLPAMQNPVPFPGHPQPWSPPTPNELEH